MSTAITDLRGRRVWDSRGRPTVEVEIELEGGAVGRAIAPAGASTGSGEAHELRDGGPTHGGLDVTQAVANANTEIKAALVSLDAADQQSIDTALIELDGTEDKSRLGANTIVATSMAVAWAAANTDGVPLWRHLGGSEAAHLPLPEVQIFGGGAHAARRVDIQDFMVIPVGADSYVQALDWVAEVYRAAGALMAERGRLQGVADEGGYWPAFDTNEEVLETLLTAIERAHLTPGDEVAISLDVAASEFGSGGHYLLASEDRHLDSDELIALLVDWTERFPIVSIEDPLGEDDGEALARFTRAVGDRVQVVGDDFLVTSADRVAAAAESGACNALLVKPNQAGTLTEARRAHEAARAAGWSSIVSARSGETEDVTIVHLAVGWGAPQLKVGSFARSERLAKWNEGLRVAEALGGDGPLPDRSSFPWGRSR